MTMHAEALTSDQQQQQQQQQQPHRSQPQVGGRFSFDDGGAYCGGWAAGKADGHGVCTGPAGQGRYEGAWNRGYETSGTYTWPSGHSYAGQWNQGKRHGLGEETKGKWTYRGEWTQGFKGRYGLRQSSSSCARYAGTWTTGVQDGYGVETYADGGSYRGQWLQGSRHGFGIRQSVPYGVAVHYRQKTVGGATQPSSSQSSVQTVDDDDHPPASARRARDQGRGGFVLVARSDSTGQSTTARSVGVGVGFRGAVARTLKLRKQVSAGEASTPRTGRRPGRDSSGSRSASEDRESAHTDSCTSFISQDDVRSGGGNPSDISVVETYAGEWKNDKRSGYGVCERTDGVKFEGEWFNNKKNGYGVTTFQDGSVEEGKYRDNELITLLPSNKSTSGMFAIRTKKLRERIDSAVMQANHAAQVALEKTDIATARMEAARTRTEQTKAVARKAHADAALACQKSAEFEHIELHVDATWTDVDVQSNVDATASEPERRQSRSLSIIARALGKGLDARRPSTVAAVFAAATSTLAPTRWSRRASSVRPSAADSDDEASARPKKSTANSVTWKDAGNPTTERRTDTNANTMPDNPRSVEQIRAIEQTNAGSTTASRLSSQHAPVMTSSHLDHQQQLIGDNSSTWPRHHWRHNDTDNDDVTTTTQRRRVDDDNVLDRRPKHDGGGGDYWANAGPRTARVDPVRGSSPSRRLRIVGGLDGPPADDQDAEYWNGEERDELSALRSDAAAPAGGRRLDDRSVRPSRYHPVTTTTTTTVTSSPASVTQPSRRLTLPSIVKYPETSNPSPTSSSSRHAAIEAKPDVSKTKPDTYVIINGARKRVTDDVSSRRQQSGTVTDGHWSERTASMMYNEDSDYRDDDVLPRRYALQPVAPTTRNPGVAGPSTSTRNRGSLPDVFAEAPAMSRQEAHLLSNWRREELRQIREEEDRRGRLSVILSVGLLRDWYSRQKFLILVLALNVSLAAVFWHLLTTS